jgi:hypothetical protein
MAVVALSALEDGAGISWQDRGAAVAADVQTRSSASNGGNDRL